jgi:flagellar basal body-associated protein FliL
MVQQAPAPVKKANSGRNIVIIVVIVAIVLCCVCGGGGFLYFCGDMITGAGKCGF